MNKDAGGLDNFEFKVYPPGYKFPDPLSDRIDKMEESLAESLRLVRVTLEAENRVLDMLVDKLAEMEEGK